MSRESICSVSTFLGCSGGLDVDNVVGSGTKGEGGGGALKKRQETPN